MHKRLNELVEKQLRDTKLWFGNDIDYVRKALRTLTAVVEDDPMELIYREKELK